MNWRVYWPRERGHARMTELAPAWRISLLLEVLSSAEYIGERG